MDTYSFTAASAIGGRSYQEDRWIAALIPNSESPQGWLLSVLDGHGSAQTSDRSAKRLLELFQTSLEVSSDPPAVLKQCVATLVAEAESDTSGSTLSELSRFLRRDPEMFEMSLGPDSVILVGSDGLLDAFEGFIEKQLMHLIQMIKNGGEARNIVQDALQRGAEDNVTAIVWRATRLSSKALDEKELRDQLMDGGAGS